MVKLMQQVREMCSLKILEVDGGRTMTKPYRALLAGAVYLTLTTGTCFAADFWYGGDEHPQPIAADTWRFAVPLAVRPVGVPQFVWSEYDFASATQGITVDYAFNGAGIDYADTGPFEAIAPTLSDQIHGYINGWDAGAMTGDIFSGVVHATAQLTAVHLGIEADRLVPVLRFPLRGPSRRLDLGWNADSATIRAVFDHTMTDATGRLAPYGRDQLVTAYTGESGAGSPSGKHARNDGGNADKTVHPPFVVNGHYSGGGDPKHLHADGHPGVDYRATLGTEVYAAASGTIHYPANIAGLGSDDEAYSLYHVLELTPDDTPNVRVYYMHLSTHPASRRRFTRRDQTPGCPSRVTLPLPEGSHVDAGCLVALSGHAGPKGTRSQLHFEVQAVVPLRDLPPAARDAASCPEDPTAACVPIDPYGWEGSGPDPFEQLTGVANTRLWQ